MNLDDIDLKLLRLLREDARRSNKKLAELVNLAESSCLMRVRRLQEQGVISGYHADIDPNKMSVGLQAMISVRLTSHATAQLAQFRAYLLDTVEVLQLFHVTGDRDFLVHVWAQNTNHLRDFTLNTFAARDEVANIETGIIFEHDRTAHVPVVRNL